MLAKGLGGWYSKKTVFADVQYCIYADICSWWVCQKRSKNVQNNIYYNIGSPNVIISITYRISCKVCQIVSQCFSR